MENKDRFFSLEYFLTFIFLSTLAFFFPQEASSIRICLLAGFIIGSVIAYISYDKLIYFRKLFTLAASILILSWTVYAALKSSFLYRELIVICIISLSLLIVVNSFSLCLRRYLSSVQIFGILLFLCLSALIRDYNKYFLISASGLVIVVSIVAKIKFHNLFTYSEKTSQEYRVVNPLLVTILFLAMFTAWILFMNVPLGQISSRGFLKDEDSISWQEQKPQEQEKNTFLQDEQIQKELTNFTLGLSSADQMHQMLAWMQDLLVQEAPYAFEVSKAEKNIIKALNDQSAIPNLSNTAGLKDRVKRYVDSKITKNLAQIKNNIGKVINDNHIGLLQRFSILSAVNKIEYSDSYASIDKYSQQLKRDINNKFMPDSARKQLSQLSKQLKEWKSFQLFHKKIDSFQDKANTNNVVKREELNDLVKQINEMEKVSAAVKIDKTIEKMLATGSSDESKLIGEAKDLLGLKKEMLASKESSQLRKKLEGSKDKPNNLEELLNSIEESKDRQDAVKKITQLLESLTEMSNFQLPQEARDMLEAKLDSLIKESSDAVKKQIKETNFVEHGKGLLEDLRKMVSEKNKGKLASSAAKMQKTIEADYKQGNISKEEKDNLIKDTKTTEQLLNMRIELAGMQDKDKAAYEASSLDYMEKASELLQSSSLENEQRELMDKLMEKLANAQTVSQVEDVLSAINQQISASGKKESTAELEKMKELMQKAADAKKMFILEKNGYSLRKNIESLKNVLPQQAAFLQESLDKMKESKTRQDLIENIDALSKSLEIKQTEKAAQSENIPEALVNRGDGGSLKIYLLPDYAILPRGSSILLKSITTYNNFIRESGSELEWFSVDPAIAFVDQHGLVSALGTGQTEILCRYKGGLSVRCKVTVVEVIPQAEAIRIKDKLGEQAY
ncbi:MAG: hypothetical protein Q7S42_02980 [Candidatus Omnitrophota bacterium]|nr:hypothetical protein [Candidatus Omnitrophota bacterium]